MKTLFTGIVALCAVGTGAFVTGAQAAPPRGLPARMETMPVTGILAAANVQGIVRYCAQKKYLTDTEARAAMSANPVKGTDPAVDELARQAKNVGERGVMFVIAKSQGKDTKTLPAFALEDIAMRDQATPQDVCRKLVQAEEKGAEPAEGRKPDE